MSLNFASYIQIFIALLSVSVFSNPGGNDEARQRLRQIYNEAPSGIDSNVWKRAVTSYLSQCSGGGENCKCALVIAQGISGDIKSATMWIGTFKGGSPIMLWTGYASRLASREQNRSSVNMETDRCKRRNGVATVTGNTAKIPGRKPRDVSVYRNLANELGLPSDVALTSFYFSTPMQNETYKFHDFYECKAPPCPRTLGCLGLERHAMKALCLNHMGSNGSNGIDAPERGGAWLYFHNVNAPEAKGSDSTAAEGLANFANGIVCSDTSTAHLSSGEIIAPDASYGNISNGSNDNQNYYSNPVGSATEAGGLSLDDVGDFPVEEDDPLNEDDEFVRKILDSCQKTVSDSCPNVDLAVIRDYCADQKSYDRGACEFNRKDSIHIDDFDLSIEDVR